MKILFVSPEFLHNRNAIGEYVYFLAKALLKKSHQVIVLTKKCTTDCNLQDHALQYNDGLDSKTDPKLINVFPSIINFKNDLSEKLAILDRLYKPDIISFQYEPYSYSIKGLPFYLVNVLGKYQHKGLSITFHEVYARNYLFGNILSYFASRCQILIARNLSNKATINFTALDSYIQALRSKNIIHKSFIGSNIGYNDTKPFLISNYTFATKLICFGNKNFLPVLSVVDHLRTIHKIPVTLTIAGGITNSYMDELLCKIKKLGLCDCVIIKGYISNDKIESVFNSHGIFIDTNYLDGKKRGGTTLKSGSLAAAFKFGKVIIGFKGDMTDELLAHEKHIWFCDSSNTNDIAESIKKIIESPLLYESLSAGAHSFYNSYLTWDVISDKFIKAFLKTY